MTALRDDGGDDDDDNDDGVDDNDEKINVTYGTCRCHHVCFCPKQLLIFCDRKFLTSSQPL